jgi:hypothetical protein
MTECESALSSESDAIDRTWSNDMTWHGGSLGAASDVVT